MVLKTILVALDNTELTAQVIGALNHLKLKQTEKIIFAHVLPPPSRDWEVAPERPHSSLDSCYQEIDQQLESCCPDFPGSTEIKLVNGDPAEEIIRLANIYGADLIVIGTRGLKGVKRIIEGSVSSQVVADAPCTVLIAKS